MAANDGAGAESDGAATEVGAGTDAAAEVAVDDARAADLAEATEDAADSIAAAVDPAPEPEAEATDPAADMADAPAEEGSAVATDDAEATTDEIGTAITETIEPATEPTEGAEETAAPASPQELLTVEGFDYDAVIALIDDSEEVSPLLKTPLKQALEQARDNPDLLAAALERVRDALGIEAPAAAE